MPTTLTPTTRRAIKAYGAATCLEALCMHECDGEGASTIGFYKGLKTQQADAAINAGRELHAADFIPADGTWVKRDEAERIAYAQADEVGMPVTTVRTLRSHGWTTVNFTAHAAHHDRNALRGFTALPSAFFTPAWRGEA